MKLFFFIFTLIAVAFGMAQAKGCICTADYRPVCSTSRKTYSNRCHLNCAGAKFLRNGAC